MLRRLNAFVLDSSESSDSCSGDGVAGFASVVEDLAPATRVLQKGDEQRMYLALCLAEDQCRDDCHVAATCDAKHAPAMMVYSSDCTPHLQRTWLRVCTDAGAVNREFGRPVEWLLHRGYLVWPDSKGEWAAKILFGVPVEMASKKMWHQYAVADKFLPHLRSWHPHAVSISWYSFDRGVLDCLSRLLRRRHYQHLASIPEDDRELAEAKDWVIHCGCADHDVQNALCKGVGLGHLQLSQLYKALFRSIRSARDSMDALVQHLEEWLRTLVIEHVAHDEESVFRVWRAVGAPEGLARELAAINLRCEGGALRCHAKVLERDDPVAYIGRLILSGYRIRSFSSSRFLSTGRSCQGLAASLLLGLQGHMATTRLHDDCSEWYAHCWDDLDAGRIYYACKTAVAAHVTDKIHVSLLCDDRVAKHLDRFVGYVTEQLHYLNFQLPTLLFERLAALCEDCTPEKLESDVLRAAYTATAFMDRRIFREARNAFWTFCRSADVKAAVRSLAPLGVVPPPHPLLRKIQYLVRRGSPAYQMKEACDLALEGPWSILKTEQMNAAGSQQHKHHERFTPCMHASRTALTHLRPMVRAPYKKRRRFKEEVRLQHLKRRRPENVGAQGLLLKETMADGLAELGVGASAAQRLRKAQSVVRLNSKTFKALNHEQKSKLERMSLERKRTRRRDINKDMDALEEIVEKKKKKLEQEEKAKTPLRMAVAGFSKQALRELEGRWRSPDITMESAEKRIRSEVASPPIPLLAERERLVELDDGRDEVVPPEIPAWMGMVAKQRVVFANTALLYPQASGGRAFVLNYASQSPVWCTFMELQRQRPSLSSGSTDLPPASCRLAHPFMWKVLWDKVFHEEEHALVEKPTYVVAGLEFEMKSLAWSDGGVVLFDDFVKTLPEPRKDPDNAKTRVEREKDDTLLSKHPWMRRLLVKSRLLTKSKPKPSVEEVAAEDHDMDHEEIADAVHKAYLEVASAAEASDSVSFIVEPRGGPSTAKTKGKVVDCFRATPCDGPANTWVAQHFRVGFRTASFANGTYGNKMAVQLGKVWCSIMDVWYSEYLAATLKTSVSYTPQDPHQHMTPSMAADMAKLDTNHPAVLRLNKICSVLPAYAP